MKKLKTSWLARLLLGAEITRNDEARAATEAALAELQGRCAELESELQVRTDIMNVTSIVSESDKKGDIVWVNDKFIEVSKYREDELVGGVEHGAPPLFACLGNPYLNEACVPKVVVL